jgi:hypothetical protein
VCQRVHRNGSRWASFKEYGFLTIHYLYACNTIHSGYKKIQKLGCRHIAALQPSNHSTITAPGLPALCPPPTHSAPPHTHTYTHTHPTCRASEQTRRAAATGRRQAFVSRGNHRAMPAAEVPTGVVALAGCGFGEGPRCVVTLPGGDRVASASEKGTVGIFAGATGATEFQFNAHEGGIGWRALAALGGDILVSGGDDGKDMTWNVASGERLEEAAAGTGVLALARRQTISREHERRRCCVLHAPRRARRE